MTDVAQCGKGHPLRKKKPSYAGRLQSRSCQACGDTLSTDAYRFACTVCKNYHVCMKCSNPREGRVAVGDGPYVLRLFVPPGSHAGANITVETPDGHPLDVVVPPGTAPGCGFDVYYRLSNSIIARPEPSKSPRVLGHRWFLVQACIVLQICLSPTGFLPWLPPARVELRSPLAWLLFLALAAFFTLTTVPIDYKGIRWLRFFSATAQGIGYGYLINFDKDTVLIRTVFAIALGIANAYDRLQAIEGLVAKMPFEPTEGAQGTLELEDGIQKVEVVSIIDMKVMLRYVYKPASKSATEIVELQDPRLKLDVPPRSAHDRLMQWTKGGFQLRPWGFAIGVTLAQWAIQGVTMGDVFTMKDVAIILSVPMQVYVLWIMVQRSKSNVVFCLCMTAMISTCCFEIIHFFPSVVNLTFLAVFQAYAHHVVAYLAIPVDVAVVLWVLDPSTDDIATWFLCRAAKKIVKAAKKPLCIEGRPEDYAEEEVKHLLGA